MNNIINRQLSFGYDVGKGYIIAEEEIIKLIDHMVVDKRIAKDLKQRSERNRLDVVKSLGNCDELCPLLVKILFLYSVFLKRFSFHFGSMKSLLNLTLPLKIYMIAKCVTYCIVIYFISNINYTF